MVMVGLAMETFMNYEFIYWTDSELGNLLQTLEDLKRRSLVKGDISVIPCNVRDTGKGFVYATIRCNAVDSLKGRLREHDRCDHEIYNGIDNYATIDFDTF